MLTDLETKFIQYFKLTGNSTESVIKAGYDCTPNSARVIGYRLLKKKHIKEIVTRAEVDKVNKLVNAPVNIPLMPKEYLKLPTKDEYLLKAWKRTDYTESSKKEETQAKYFEIAGKAMGVFNDSNNVQLLIYNDQNKEGVNTLTSNSEKILSIAKEKNIIQLENNT